MSVGRKYLDTCDEAHLKGLWAKRDEKLIGMRLNEEQRRNRPSKRMLTKWHIETSERRTFRTDSNARCQL